jgi:hypothetical protein
VDENSILRVRSLVLEAVERDLTLPTPEGLSELHREIVEWSVALYEATGLSPADVLYSHGSDRDAIWTFGEYVVYGSHRIFGDRWIHLVECLPSDLVEVGTRFVVVDRTGFPPGWHYEGPGTGTEILPSESDRERILRTIREVKGEEVRRGR